MFGCGVEGEILGVWLRGRGGNMRCLVVGYGGEFSVFG